MKKLLVRNKVKPFYLNVLMFLFLIGFANNAQAEGTPQLCPASTDTLLLMCNNGSYYNFGRYDGPANTRLHFRIKNPETEQVFLGFSQPLDGIDYDATSSITGFFRIKSPDGTIVQTAQRIDATTANLSSWGQANIGPVQTGGAGGYTPFVFDPSGLAAGDYYVEFNRDSAVYNSAELTFEYFDITVATKDVSPAAIDGRVFAYNWGFAAAPNGTRPIYAQFYRPFNGAFYVYTDEQYVSKVDFAGSGFRPWAFNISFNSHGTNSTGDVIYDRQSLEAGQGNVIEYAVYLNDPDETIFPSGTFGELLTDSTEIYGCAETGYFIKVVATKTGMVEILLDQDQATGVGVYDPGTADRLIAFNVEQQLTDTIVGVYIRHVPWDGLDGLGATVDVLNPIPLNVTFSQGSYHFPIYDAEYNTGGFTASIVRPTPPVSYTLGIYYDDSDITEATDTTQETVGCAPPCHAWADFNFGNENTINTWWFAKQEIQNVNLVLTPDCGGDTDGDTTYDALDIDWDNDGIPNFMEACVNLPYTDSMSIDLAIQMDNYPGEITWDVKDTSGTIVESGSGYSAANALESISFKLVNGTYDFTIYDSFGDGFCCTYGNGNFEISINGVKIVEGLDTYGLGNGQFDDSTRVSFDHFDYLFSCYDSDPTKDSDYDNIPDYKDSDFCTLNSFGICAALDADNDGIPSFLDLDSDNDGIPDIIEAGGTDANNDGLVDFATIGDPSTMADADNDGLADAYDPDQTALIDNPDTDGDGTSDFFDLDSDNDGIADLVEVYGLDVDGNGMVDNMDNPATGDTNDDGWEDATTASPLVDMTVGDNAVDFDGDDIPNHLDLDSDDDGITDVIESGGLDGNSDGMADDGALAGTRVDTNNDGWEDNYDAGVLTNTADGADANSIVDFETGRGNPDFDADGLPNWLDIDADDDGLVDNHEAQLTPSGSYIPPTTGASADTDDDGLNDAYDTSIGVFGGAGLTPVNTDMIDDGQDYLDLDTDNDKEEDIIEGHDTDGNGVVDGSDAPNADTGVATGTDSDMDGLDDGFDNNDSSINPANTSLTPESYANFDENSTTERDWRETTDIDLDNDGVVNSAEDGGTGFDPTADADGDGIQNSADDSDVTATFPAWVDTNNDGINDVYDTDLDGISDYADLDSDNDGIPDLVEAGGQDTDNDGVADDLTDTDLDGLVDIYDGTCTNPSCTPGTTGTDLTPADTDNDGQDDMYDLDSDNDGIADLVEVGGVDTDGNGMADDMINPVTGDMNVDGWSDAIAGSPLVDSDLTDTAIDFDGDSYPNHLDLDSDDDGITDVRESGGSDGNNDGIADDGAVAGTRTDANGDGWEDNYDNGILTTAVDGVDPNTIADFPTGFGNPDYDADGQPNWLDIDADNDGIVDVNEAQLTPTGTYIAPTTGANADTDGDGLNDAYDSSIGTFAGSGLIPVNTDNQIDGADYLDTDTDGDLENDIIEGHDTDGNGVVNGSDSPNANTGIATGLDADLDGLDDGFDNNNSSKDPTNNNLEPESYVNFDDNSTNERDWREFSDIDLDDDGIPNANETGTIGFNPIGDEDGDGTPNFADTSDPDIPFTDTNGDGVNDGYDTDLDGIPDYTDLDSDNDGIPDIVEAGGVDTNGDGRVDDPTDTDSDGLADTYDSNCVTGGCTPATTGTDLTASDTDGDGLVNPYDIDSDNDGIPDLVEAGGVDANGDGIVDVATDADSDGLADVYDENASDGSGIGGTDGTALVETNGSGVWQDGTTGSSLDTDGDNLVDGLDLDSDNDGIPDVIEAGGMDSDNDGHVDYAIAGNPSTMADADGDGLVDTYDPDQNSAIANPDTDGDGTTNVYDLDSDNDGIADLVEVGGVDTDGNGMVDEMLVPATGDTDTDGWADVIETTVLVDQAITDNAVDFDGDTYPNHLDLDSDNDGITDVTESGGQDGNSDGLADDGSMAGTLTDSNSDGWDDNYDNGVITVAADGADAGTRLDYPTGSGAPDFDGDGLPNWLDIDADDDGIVDNSESQQTSNLNYVAPGVDNDGDGLSDSYEVAGTIGSFGGAGLDPVNTDGSADGPDYLDLNTDNDGENDILEAHDTDGSGVVDGSDSPVANTGLATGNDTDNDGLDDGFDNNIGSLDPTDGNLEPESYANIDDASTNERDWREITDIDVDNDGIPNSDEDGGTGFDPLADADGDGVPNFQDDSDTSTGFPEFNDNNGDGINDVYDADQDGIPDYVDLDADNDGIPDIVEAGGVDTNGDGRADDLTDSDDDGLVDLYDGTCDGGCTPTVSGADLNPADTDNDGIDNLYDLDADNDGIPDIVEAGGIDTNGDGRVDVNTDADEDGLADIFDENATDGTGPGGTNGTALVETNGSGTWQTGGTGLSLDQDGDNFTDGLDLDADNDGIPDIIEAGGTSINNDGMVDTGASPWDADGDGLADVYDENASDGPMIAGTNGTALVETTADQTNDGRVNNSNESMTGGGANQVNADGDALANHLDLDADDDGITDVVENAAGSTNADHSAGTLDGVFGDAPTITDGDNNGWHDSAATATTDTDGDSIPDYLDIDADNDGIPDYLEGVCSAACPIPSGGETDANDNGVLDIYESLDGSNAPAGGSNIGATPNLDADDTVDTTPDYLDNDTDEDGAYDWSEGFDADMDGEAMDDLIAMVATYATNNSGNAGPYVNGTDTDSDGIPDWLDNLNGDGYTETTPPPFLTVGNPAWLDANGNGLVDLFDVAMGGTLSPLPDANGGDSDWRDMATIVILPVELINFDAQEENCEVVLNWESAQEEGFDYFEVMRSEDGLTFTSLGKVQSTGKGGDLYRFTDEKPKATNYYRLRMLDLNGALEYSELVIVESECESDKKVSEMSVFPNPVGGRDILNLRHKGFSKEFKVTIVSQSGKLIRELQLTNDSPVNEVPLDVSELPAGMYWINAFTTDGVQSIKFVKL